MPAWAAWVSVGRSTTSFIRSPSTPNPNHQELEAERQALTARQAELQGKLAAGATLSKEEGEALAGLEAQLSALRAKEGELPKEVGAGECVAGWLNWVVSDVTIDMNHNPYLQLEAARAREAELSGLLKGKKEELKALTAQQGEYINDLTRGVVMYKHLGLDFEREFWLGFCVGVSVWVCMDVTHVCVPPSA